MDLFFEVVLVVSTSDTGGTENRRVHCGAEARSKSLQRSDDIVVSDFTVFRAQRRVEHSDIKNGSVIKQERVDIYRRSLSLSPGWIVHSLGFLVPHPHVLNEDIQSR